MTAKPKLDNKNLPKKKASTNKLKSKKKIDYNQKIVVDASFEDLIKELITKTNKK